MDQQIGEEVTREELLRLVRRHFRVRVTPSKLLRWHNADLLPQPRRRGLGRGRGTTSIYPGTAVFQAGVLASLLRQRRSLRDAGWFLWVFGFPVTRTARQVLHGELTAKRRELARASRSLERGALRDRLRNGGRIHGLERMQKVVTGDALVGVARVLTATQLGQLHRMTKVPVSWDDFQAAVLTQLQPALAHLAEDPDYDPATDPDRASPPEVEAGWRRLSDRVSIPRLIHAIDHLDEQWFCIIRNEAQAFYEWAVTRLGGPPTALMPRDAFIDYLKLYLMGSKQEIIALRKAFGWTRPPLSPLQQLVQRHVTKGAQHPTKGTTTP